MKIFFTVMVILIEKRLNHKMFNNVMKYPYIFKYGRKVGWYERNNGK